MTVGGAGDQREIRRRRTKRRARPDTKVEEELTAAGAQYVVGMDEVGRGAWAGPVSVGAVLWRPAMPRRNVRDSKLLSPAEREEVADRLRKDVLYAVGHAWNDEIDAMGMIAALALASRRALESLPIDPDHVILDGNIDFLAGVAKTRCVIGADRRCLSVAAASVIAKVTRDALMVDLAGEDDRYAFISNKGYPAPAHKQALAEFGPSSLHRHSWAPIRALSAVQLQLG